MMNDFYAVIMAGGGGTRLWPLSRKSRPKQSLRLFDEKPLLKVAVDRVSPLIPMDRIMVVTVEEQAEQLQEMVPELPVSNFILEPSPKGTASVVGLAATLLEGMEPDSVMAVLTADHFIRDEGSFRSLLQGAYQVALTGDLITLGISPTFASTGYGYIQRGDELGQIEGYRYYRSLGFREKPPMDLAMDYFSSGDYSWNSGMFIWKSSRILEEIQRYMPELAQGLAEIGAVANAPEMTAVLKKVWMGLESETIDYGIMELAEGVVVFSADNLGWIDIGSWDRLFEIMEGDDNGNIVLSDSSILINTAGTLVINEGSADRGRLIALLGAKNLIVVDTGDVILICNRSNAEDVRKIVKMLSDQGMDSYL
jgi:mannose-1-phosphate guanylyltransferase